MTDALALSVILPVYNRRDMVMDAVHSVLDQELPPGIELELIVVDDGSSDGTRELVAAHAAGESRMRLLALPHCGMPGAVRNRGVEAARAELIALLDSDDRWLPLKLQQQLPLHTAPAAAPVRISHTRERWMRAGREVSQRRLRHRRRGDLFPDALRKCIIGPSTVMMERNLYLERGGFREDLEIAEDYEFWLRITLDQPVAYLDSPLTEKRAGDWDQLSSRYPQIEGFRIAALRPLVQAGRLQPREHEARAELARKLRIHAAGARRRGRVEEARGLEREAAQL